MKKPVERKPTKPGYVEIPNTSVGRKPLKPGQADLRKGIIKKPGMVYMDNTSLNGSLAEWKAAQAKKKR